MINIYLSVSEHRHFADLYEGAGIYRIDPSADAKTRRERTIMALESVLPRDGIRALIGDREVQVLLAAGPRIPARTAIVGANV
jgi:hypothetical protein